jgi:hypothetical protein
MVPQRINVRFGGKRGTTPRVDLAVLCKLDHHRIIIRVEKVRNAGDCHTIV